MINRRRLTKLLQIRNRGFEKVSLPAKCYTIRERSGTLPVRGKGPAHLHNFELVYESSFSLTRADSRRVTKGASYVS